jgi:plasmid stabilization system protein ParE
VPISLILTEKAEEDLEDAYHWYEKQEPGLGKQVIRCIDAKIANINRHPLHHPVVQNENVRRALVNRFPFSVYFEYEEELITIFAILHQRRSPDFWKSRI